MSLFEDITLSVSDRMTKFDEATDKYRKGERNIGEQVLMGASTAVGMFSDIPGEALMAVLPDPVKRGLAQVAEGVMNTRPAQAYMDWRAENPRAAENIERTLGLGAEFAGGKVAQSTAGEAFESAARNAPNKLEGFYGSGTVGQLGAVAKAVPRTVASTAEELLVPSSRAAARGGVNPTLRKVAKEELKEGGDLSFLEGQMDQTNLLNIGAGKKAPMLDEVFGDVQTLGTGSLDEGTIKDMFTKYKPEQYAGVKVDDELIGQITERVKRAQGMDSDAMVVIRHPTALTDLFPESTARGGAAGKRMFKARAMQDKYFPEKKGFTGPEDMREFIGTKNLVDTSWQRVDGKPLTPADRQIIKYVGPGERYKPKETGLKNIEDYYKYKRMEADGKKFTKPQREKYDKLKGRVERGMADVEFDSQGRAYFQSSHRSAAKGLGGVNDQYMVDMDGNVMHYLNDENDLFGMSMPGDKRVVTVTPPSVYNLWGPKGKSPPDVKGREFREKVGKRTEEKYNAPYRGTGRDAMRRQMGESVVNYRPKTRPSDYAKPMVGVGYGTGLLTAEAQQQRED